MTNTTNLKSGEFILGVTQEEYDAAIAKGWNDNDIHKPGKHRYRRVSLDQVYKASNAKIKVELWVLLDVLGHYEDRAGKAKRCFISRAMIAELRVTMERDKQVEQAVIEKLLSNEKFIQAAAEKIAAQNLELKAA